MEIGTAESTGVKIGFGEIDIVGFYPDKVGMKNIRFAENGIDHIGVADNVIFRFGIPKRTVFEYGIFKVVRKKAAAVEAAVFETGAEKRAGIDAFAAEIFVAECQKRKVSVFP